MSVQEGVGNPQVSLRCLGVLHTSGRIREPLGYQASESLVAYFINTMLYYSGGCEDDGIGFFPRRGESNAKDKPIQDRS